MSSRRSSRSGRDILIYNWKDVRHPEVGGAEVIAFEFARRLMRRGHRVTWFARQFPGGAAEERIDGIRVVRRGGILSTYLHGWWFYRSLPRKPDVVIDMINTLAWQTPLFVRRPARRVAYLNQLAREVFHFNLPWPISILAYWLEDLQYLTYHHTPLICYSASTAADAEAVGFDRTTIAQFPLGLDHARYRPGHKARDPLFVFVARLSPMKRPELVIEAAALLVPTVPKLRLVIIGDGPAKASLQRLIEQRGLTQVVRLIDNAFFLDRATGDPKVAFMQAAWAHVLPSVKEGWGMVVTECAACGTPSIVTDVSGLRDAVKDGRTGLVVSANPTPSELAEAMERLIVDRRLRLRLSHGARAFAKTLTWDTSFRLFVAAVQRTTTLKL